MQMLEFTAGPQDAGQRMDRWLAGCCTEVSRSALQVLIEQGMVLRSGRPVNKKDKVAPGDTVQLTLPDPQPIEAIPQNIPLDIVYEDEHLLVVAKDDATHQGLSAQMAVHDIHRVYHAVVYGNLKEDTGMVDAPIGRDPRDRKKMAVTQQNSKPARTHWKVLERFGNFTYIACKLETGRTHQIRVHMASIGHPLAGDPVYGPRAVLRFLNGQCLHAKELGFVHPITGEALRFDSELPPYFQDYLTRLRKEHRR